MGMLVFTGGVGQVVYDVAVTEGPEHPGVLTHWVDGGKGEAVAGTRRPLRVKIQTNRVGF